MIVTLHTFYFYLDTLAIISDDSFTIFSYVFKLLASSPIFQSSVDDLGYFNETEKIEAIRKQILHSPTLRSCLLASLPIYVVYCFTIKMG